MRDAGLTNQPQIRAETVSTRDDVARASAVPFDFSRLASLRYLTVLMIAIGYASTMAIGPNTAEIFSHFGYDPSWIGVKILFFFSGIMALRSLQNGHIGLRYMRSRILHVGPLLFAVTLLTVLLIFPLFGKAGPESGGELLRYFILTVSCLDPGRQLPGLLDDAAYACLIQGAIWTLRWGLLLHIGCAVLGRFESLRRPPLLLVAAVSVTTLYISLTYLAVRQDWAFISPTITGLRLAYPFVIGMAVWAYRDSLPKQPLTQGLILVSFMAAAVIKYSFGPWSPFIEVSLTLFWGYAAWLILSAKTTRLRAFENWPRLAAGLYLIIWPVTQIVVMSAPTLSPNTVMIISVPIAMIIGAVLQFTLTLRFSRQSAVKA